MNNRASSSRSCNYKCPLLNIRNTLAPELPANLLLGDDAYGISSGEGLWRLSFGFVWSRRRMGLRRRVVKMGFVPSHEEKGRLLKKYWTVPGRQIETSVVFAESKESTSFLPDRSVSLTGIVFIV